MSRRVSHYELTEDLKVFSHRKDGTSFELKQSKDQRGYLRVCMMQDGARVYKDIHRWIAEKFIENPQPDIFDCVDHIDSDKLNNSLENLRWCTRSQNTRWGTTKVMTPEVVKEAARLLNEDLTGAEVARRLGISRFTLSSWKRKNFKNK